jgi:hypothetical protein
MDIHKPKPWHGWRDFLKEFGTIVLGVSVALAAEQGVEWWHWQGEVSLARKSLYAEIAANDDWYARRIANVPCVDQKLDKIGEMINAAAAGTQPKESVTHFNGLGAPTSDSDWQSERSSQILTHFPRDELALLSQYYSEQPTMVDWGLQEANAWAELAVLLDAPQKLSQADIAKLRTSYHLARRFAYIIASNARRQLATSDALGIRYSIPKAAQQDDRCNATSRQTRF